MKVLTNLKRFYLHSGLQAPRNLQHIPSPPRHLHLTNQHIFARTKNEEEGGRKTHPTQYHQSMYECIQKTWKGIYCWGLVFLVFFF